MTFNKWLIWVLPSHIPLIPGIDRFRIDSNHSVQANWALWKAYQRDCIKYGESQPSGAWRFKPIL